MYKAEGLLLRTHDLREADKILTIYTRERGKVSAVARGCRRAKSRLLAVSQLFSHSRYLIYEGRGLHTINQGELINTFRPLREDLTRVAYSSYAAELLNSLVDESEPNSSLFRIVLDGFTLLAGTDDLDLALRWFELMLMDQLGYRPELSGCVECGSELKVGGSFSAQEGGTLCHDCRGSDPSAIPVHLGVIVQLRRLLDTSAARLGILRPSQVDRQMMERILRAHIDYRLARPIRSRGFLDSMKALESG